MIAEADLEVCRQAIRAGSRSFHAASRLLPFSVRDPALALYAFCRLADDAVDLQAHKLAAVQDLRERLDLAYRGTPRNAAADRAMTAIVDGFEMPRALPDALLEGLAWDAVERRYTTLSELRSYAARVAAAVGAMMCVLMRVRNRDALARACDLGVAMQLTNIARDVGEDAAEGRVYLPTIWLSEAGMTAGAFLASPSPTPEIRAIVKRLLAEADRLYRRAETGIAILPLASRPGIFAARHLYDGIGGRVARAGYDSISSRASTGGARKVGWLALSLLRTGATVVMPRSAILHARALPEVQFLVTAAAQTSARQGEWSEKIITLLTEMERRDRLGKQMNRGI